MWSLIRSWIVAKLNSNVFVLASYAEIKLCKNVLIYIWKTIVFYYKFMRGQLPFMYMDRPEYIKVKIFDKYIYIALEYNVDSQRNVDRVTCIYKTFKSHKKFNINNEYKRMLILLVYWARKFPYRRNFLKYKQNKFKKMICRHAWATQIWAIYSRFTKFTIFKKELDLTVIEYTADFLNRDRLGRKSIEEPYTSRFRTFGYFYRQYFVNQAVENDQTYYNYFNKPIQRPSMWGSRDITKNNLFYGLRSIFNGVSLWIYPLLFGVVILYTLLTIKKVPFSIIIFEWFCLLMFLYWLLSGFVFFIKKYQFSKYTSVIQRFWRRSYILFWLIESCLLVVFIYLTLNATQQPIFMADQQWFLKKHLFSWKLFFLKLYPSVLLILFGYILLLNLKWNTFKKNSLFLIIITVLLTYFLWVEFYQIYHVFNFYGYHFWIYNGEERTWILENDVRRSRILNHYVMILFILKFWHIVFIFGFWVFFILRANEYGRVRYPLFSANFQNFLILYIMNWLYMYPWFKMFFRKYLDMPYYWFYLNTRDFMTRVFLSDLWTYYYGFWGWLKNLYTTRLFLFQKYDYFYWPHLAEETWFGHIRHYLNGQKFLMTLLTSAL